MTQSAETRSFVYDSLKRLTSAANPESGTIRYPSYDNNGNLLTKTDARGITTTSTYDALNRVLTTTYSDGTPGVQYSYDTVANGIGYLASVNNANSFFEYTAYDAMGRVTGSNQVTGNLAYPFSYTYNLAGGMTTETYPSGRVATTSFDGAGRQLGVSGALSGQTTNYVSGVTYWPHGAEWAMTYGNNVVPVATYNNRLQASSTYATIGNNLSDYLLFLGYGWGTTNNNGTLGTGSEGYGSNVPWSSLTWLNQSYSYDGVNRLSSVSDSGYSRSFGYDAYGNGWVAGNSGVPLAGNTPTSDVFGTNNQISGTSYDAAGNQLSVNGNTSAYDAENRQVSVTEAPAFGGGVEQYLYDGLGHRIEEAGPSGLTVYVYDVQSRLIAEYGTTGATSPCTTCYLVADMLGTPRLVTDASTKIIGRHDYLPFGEEIAANTAGRNALWGPTVDTITQKFTGKERDTESGLDYFGARYYGSALGRLTSPDPVFASPERVADPQQWNMYAYVRNNPLSRTDPTGLDFNLTCSGRNTATCHNGLQGQTVDGKFQATDVDMNKAGDASAGYHDQFGNQYTGTFDQNNGVSFTNTATGDTSSNSRFIDGSDRTDVNGSGAFSGIQGQFNSNCGGSCEAKGSLYDLPGNAGAIANLEKMIGVSFEDNLNFFGGHGID